MARVNPASWPEDNPRPKKVHPGHTGKRRFPDEISAKLAMAGIQRRSSRPRVPQRAYRCDVCKGWHLTSQKVLPKNLRGPELSR